VWNIIHWLGTRGLRSDTDANCSTYTDKCGFAAQYTFADKYQSADCDGIANSNADDYTYPNTQVAWRTNASNLRITSTLAWV
jgi:hypothetical protein